MCDSIECSVIIPTYNRAHLLELTLQSLCEQDVEGLKYEIIICDDGSTDNTEEVYFKYRDRIPLSYIFQPDLGFRVAKARNKGIVAAKGRICIFLDSGVFVKSNFLTTHLRNHRGSKRNAVIGMVFGFNVTPYEIDELKRDIDRTNFDASINGISKQYPDLRRELYLECDYSINRLLAPWLAFWGGNISARRVDIVRCGAFDENLVSWGGEDIDLGYRLFKSGVNFLVDRDIQSVHYPHLNCVSENNVSAKENYMYLKNKFDDDVFDIIDGKSLVEINSLLESLAEA